MTKNNILNEVKNYIAMTGGCIILGFSINYFFIANKLAQGGVTGVSIILHYLFNIDLSLLYLIFNIPLLLIGYKILGKSFLIKTLYATFMFSLFLKLFQNFSAPMEDILVASIFGGVLSGLGVGIILVSGGSSGGTDIIGKIIYKYKGIPIGKTLFFFDFIILSWVGLIFGKNIVMYTLISLLVSAKVVDIIQEGIISAKGVTIITSQPDEIKTRISNELRRGVTILCGRGGYTNREMDIIYCIVGKYQIVKLKNIVEEIDPSAFMTVTYVNEVIGNGFSKEQKTIDNSKKI